MSTSPSRRKLFRALFAAGLAWLGLRAAARAAPVIPPPPLTDTAPRMTAYHTYTCDGSGHVTTYVYDCHDRLVTVQGGFDSTITYSYDTSGGPSRPRPPKKS